jgi:alpha/beta hydrolase family protein
MPRPLAVLLPLLTLASLAHAAVPVPAIDGPISGPGTAFVQSTTFDLAQVGYVEAEFFVSGTASAYVNQGDLGVDGKWTVTPAGTATYKTRIVVRRPADRRKFNGTVIVEWLNVTGGLDAAPDWTQSHVELIRDGFAWVGVSAQYVGIEGGGGLLPIIDLHLKQVNPARYGSLHHPGDSFSYDMFSQVGAAVRNGSGATKPLGDLKPKKVIAAGESQSAFRLVTYVDAIHPLARVYDGYLIHSRSGMIGAALSESPEPAIAVPGGAHIRRDLGVPVLTFETETDLAFLDYLPARQPDTRRIRAWEVAGTAHVDAYLLVLTAGPQDLGTSTDIVAPIVTATPIPGILECGAPINSGPQHFVLNAAFAALNRWVRRGKPPRRAPRLEVQDGSPPTIMTDAHGNALGGIRTPEVDVPIATFSGRQSGSILCQLFGTTTPFDAATLLSLYPDHDAFVAAYGKSLRRAVRSGFLLEPDAKLIATWAKGAPIPQ